MNTVKALTDVGFDHEEARVYEAALMLGRATITELARKADLKRPSVYNYAESLLRHDLLSREIKGKRRLYVAQNPNKILKSLAVKRAGLEKTLPMMSKMYASSRKKPVVEFFENKQEVKRAYAELSQSLSTLYAIFSVQDFSDAFSFSEIMKLNKGVESLGTKIYDLVESNPVGKKYAKQYKVKNHQIRFLPKDFVITTDTLVTNDTVFLVSFKNMMGIRIQNEDIAEFFKNTFKVMWETRG